jgi:hypothetical protein
VVNEFSVEVLNAPFNFAFILRVRWMSKMSLNTMSTAPVLPLLFELRAMIRREKHCMPAILVKVQPSILFIE